jgi:rhodanese-related sulfurtransferase
MNGLEFISAAKQNVTLCNPTEAAGRVAAETDLLVIDVREPAEFQAGAIASAVNIPRGMLEFQVAGACKEPSHGILLYCKSGGRAVLAAKTLAEMGYSTVTAVEGAVDDLIAACK